MDALSKRIAARWTQAGYSGWDPPDDDPEPPDPEPTWDQTVKLFPTGLQRLLQHPKKKETHGRSRQSVSLTGEVELSDESSLTVVVTSTLDEDADEDGRHGYSNETTEYTFFQGNRHWSGKDHKLKQDLREFLNQLEANDPEGYEKAN